MSNGAHSVVVLGFFRDHIDADRRRHDSDQRSARSGVWEYHERSFASSCDTYRDMTTWERWSTPQGWDFGWCGGIPITACEETIDLEAAPYRWVSNPPSGRPGCWTTTLRWRGSDKYKSIATGIKPFCQTYP